ncbi:hypothetical protein QR680_004598 [Steinernema hermaphroditum]|uniref:Uncharacterized protein n=1 Tax=Steinernema hermaphroditum TaxID=289476 RepID=A0AA39HQM7_9BILA|nr:hypothetical protein QR680_004598 [Steinernema hermaphroditum]
MTSFIRYPHCNYKGQLDVLNENYEKHRNLFIGTFYILVGFFTIIPNLVMLLAITRHPLINHACFKILTIIGVFDLFNLILACPISGMMSILEVTHCRNGIWVTSMGYVTMIAWTCYCAVHEVMALNRVLEFANKRLANRLFFGNRSWCWAIYVLLYSGLLNSFWQKPFYYYDPYGGGWSYSVIVGSGADSQSSQNNLILLVNGSTKSISLVLFYMATFYFYSRTEKKPNKLQTKITYQSITSASIAVLAMVPFVIIKLTKASLLKYAPMCMHLLWIAVNGSTAYIVIATNPYVKRQLLKMLGFNVVSPQLTATITPMSHNLTTSSSS